MVHRTVGTDRSAGFALALLTAGSLVGCGSDGGTTTPSVSVAVTPTSATLAVSEEVTLEVTVSGTTDSPTFTSSDESVAEVPCA